MDDPKRDWWTAQEVASECLSIARHRGGARLTDDEADWVRSALLTDCAADIEVARRGQSSRHLAAMDRAMDRAIELIATYILDLDIVTYIDSL